MSKKARRSPAKAAPKARAPKEGSRPRATQSRNEILEAAIEVFAEHGYEGASLPKVAELASKRHPLILYHFGSKENLWREAVAYCFADGGVLEHLTFSAKDLGPLERLKMACREFVRFAARHPQQMAILLHEGRSRNERFTWLLETYVAPFHRLLDDIIREGVAARVLKPVDPVHVAMIIVGATAVYFAAGPMLEALHDVGPRPDAFSDDLVEVVFRGIEAGV